jgi:hypothetical protein
MGLGGVDADRENQRQAPPVSPRSLLMLSGSGVRVFNTASYLRKSFNRARQARNAGLSFAGGIARDKVR